MTADRGRPGAGRRRARLVGVGVGVLLFAAAVTAITMRSDDLSGAISAAREAPSWLFLALLASIATGPLLTGASFHVLTRRYGRVGLPEMVALITGAWLLNYLPLWPGLASRVAYHKAVNRIRVADSTQVIVQASLLSALAASILAVLLIAVARPLGMTGTGAVALSLAGGLGAAALALIRSSGPEHAWRPYAALALRTLELVNWAVRYALAITIVGGSITAEGALAIAALVRLALLVPIAPNGIGVREWAIGLSAAAIAAGMTTELGLAAGLLDRAFEVAVAVPMGLLAAGLLAKWQRNALGSDQTNLA